MDPAPAANPIPARIVTDLNVERAYQVAKRGFTREFDARNTVNDWSAYITRYLGNAAFAGTLEEKRAAFVKIAALAIAAVECCDLNGGFPPRHYDPTPGPGRSPREAGS